MVPREKTAIVTGGAGALGRVIVRALLQKGFSVAIPFRSAESEVSARAFLGSAGERLLFHEADLSKESDVERFVQAVVDRFGALHVLVNAAGGYAGGQRVDEMPAKQWQQMLESNLTSAFLVCRSAVRQMRKANEGRIVNIAALSAFTPGARRAAYAVSKRGVITLTEALAAELEGTRITANAIAPGTILTEANISSMPDADREKWVRPEEIAATVLYLCSDDARSMNGSTLRMPGGA